MICAIGWSFKMGKKNKKQQTTLPQREVFMRMNFLYQAAIAVLSQTPYQLQLSRFYIHTMKSISKKLVLKMDPAIKRSICKSCDTLLIPGLTSTQRIRAHREKHIVVRCLTCGKLKRFLARRDFELWSERTENIV